MTKQRGNKKTLAMILMAVTIIFWGFDYIIAKDALASISPVQLLWLKYSIALIFMVTAMLLTHEEFTFVKKDIITFAACGFFGELMYNILELNALSYLPVSMVTVVLALVPIASMLAEWVMYKRKPNARMVIFSIICVIGVMFILGVDLEAFLCGGYLGYLLSFGAVISWVCYNFLTDKLSSGYSSIKLTFNQLLYTMIMSAPFALHSMDWQVFRSQTITIEVIYLGIVSAGVCFLIYVFGVRELGPTIPAVYSNFLPVSTAFFGWVFLHEYLSVLQIAGIVIVIASGCVVIIEKGKLEEEWNG